LATVVKTVPAQERREADGKAEDRASILIVEDEAVTALNLRMVLERAGYRVIGPAATVAAAHFCIADNRIDAALMDIDLGGDARVFPVAEVLAALRIPFAFVSGHPRRLMPVQMHGRPFLAKPYGAADIVELAKRLLA
jgi:DNA-binding LytR/AlgR family response regulator